MKRWIHRGRRRADRTAMLPSSELAIDANTMLEADSKRVCLMARDPASTRGFRSSWSREEVESMHRALGLWLETGKLEESSDAD